MAPVPIVATGNVTGTALSVVGNSIYLNGQADLVSIGITNTGAAALSGFAIARQYVDGGPFFYHVGGTDFSTPVSGGPGVLGASISNSSVSPPLSPPQSLPAGNATTQGAWIDYNPGPATAIQFMASVMSGTATLVISGAATKQPI